MKRRTAFLLQAAIVLAGIAVLAFLLWEPRIEGRNAHATNFQIYFEDPFLALVYVGSIPFFVALYRAFALVGHAGRHGAFSQVTVDALRVIQRCAIIVIAFVAVGIVFIALNGDPDDRPAGFFMGFLVALGAGTAAVAAASFARKLQRTLGPPDDSLG